MSFEEMKHQLIEWINFSDQRSNKTGDGFTAGKWNKEVFREHLLSASVTNIKELSDAYIASMYISLYNSPFPQNKRFMEKSVENAEFALDWLNLYPNAKFIHILRNPYSNIVALRKFMDRKNFSFLNRPLLGMYNSYYYLYKNIRLIDDQNYKVVIYEELLGSPEKTMKMLAEFVGIDYTSILLNPTLLGSNWSGNSTSGIHFTGISDRNIENWKREISNYEISMINELFPHVLEDFKFDVLKPKYSIKMIAKNEGIINYVLNRLALNYLPKQTTPGKKQRKRD